MGSRVELFEQIRRDRDREGLSINALARRHRVHRRTVRQALESPLPPARRRPEVRPAPKLGEFRELIDSWLIADLTAPRKQRHTAKRIRSAWSMSMAPMCPSVRSAAMCVSVVARWGCRSMRCSCRCVTSREWRRRWTGAARAPIAGVLGEVLLFVMRACFSGACFVQAFPRETQQAFLEAHVAAFDFYGGVFTTLRYEYVPGHIFVVLCPNQLCGRERRAARDHGGRQRRRPRIGHIAVRAMRASSAVSRRCARLGWCGIPPRLPAARSSAEPLAWLWC